MWYKKENNIIVSYSTEQIDDDYIETEQDIVFSVAENKMLFAGDLDIQKEAEAISKIQAEQREIVERQALEPTMADVVEALDILSNIVLGGAE